MKIAYCSDLHLDFEYPDLAVFESEAQTLFILGDIIESKWFEFAINPNSGNFGKAQKLVELFDKLNTEYETVLMVLGNHEHYYSTFQETEEVVTTFLRLHKLHNVHLLVNKTFTLKNGMVVYGDTFWTDMGGPHNEWFIRQMMNDFKLIAYKSSTTGYRKFRPSDAALLHSRAVTVVQEVKPDIVLSHHAPTEKSVHARFKGNEANAAYHSDVIETLLNQDLNPKYWFHGHMHNPVDHVINKTRVLANPRGYGKENINWKVLVIDL